ncbi:fatty acid desaturase, type 2 [Mycolicibacterium novocastrense]|uniref:Fatty acid desaturase, type 2 n=1 Tax=Mycolicibacterium novocastrense TaxID=59813 RepID=A0ABQ0KI37_MYCNV|nr:fatty acid desaturase, type 2 [Mycolicibacterium novocastrense]
MPVLTKWRIFEREDFTGEAARMRDVGVLFEELEEASQKFEESKQRRRERRIASAPADYVLTPPARPPMKGA